MRAKKITLFIDKSLRDVLETADTSGEWTRGYNAALLFFIRFLQFSTDLSFRFSAFRCDGTSRHPYTKYLCLGHGESRDLVQAFDQAHRLEACLTLHGVGECVNLEVMAYASGEREPYVTFHFAFSRDDGSLQAAGARHMFALAPKD